MFDTASSVSVPAAEFERVKLEWRTRAGGLQRMIRRSLREPFVHFLILGAALFAVNHHLQERARFTRITITKAQVQGIAQNYLLQYGELPSPRQLDALVESFIRQEVFYHEALKLGLDAGDEIVRRRLVQKYEFLQQDLAIAREPTDSQLFEFFRRHGGQYRIPEKVTFSHVYFSPDLPGEEGARAAAEQLALSLNAQGLSRAADQGDRFPGNTDFAALSRDEIARVFGREGLAQDVFSVTPGQWSVPLRSGFGWHIVYVNARQPEREASFESVHDDVRRDYLEAAAHARNAEVFAKLRQKFEIVRE